MSFFGKAMPAPDPEILAALGRVRIFENLAMKDIENLARQIEVRDYESGDVICRERESGDGMYVISEGDVEIYLSPEKGERKHLTSFGAGEFFGEMALIKEENLRTATVAAKTACRCLFLSKDHFSNLLGSSHATAAKILFKLCRVLADRLSQTSMLAAGILDEAVPHSADAESAPVFAPPPLPA